jgi:hypothetical protein
MSERLRGNENEGRPLFPVSKDAIEKAFPSGEKITREILVYETQKIGEENKDLFKHLSYDSLIGNYKGAISVNFATFRDGAIFMRRILRHQNEQLPVLSKDMLDAYTTDNKRGIANHPWSMKEYFSEKWASEFRSKDENADLSRSVDRIGESWTGNAMDSWGGAYYMARAYQRDREIRNLHNLHPEAWLK